MTEQNRFDIIIAGAGAAGLSLLWRIMNSPVLRDQSVLLIDQSFETKNDKTWCFWEDLNLPAGNLIYHSWKHLLVRIGGNIYSEPIKKYQYKCLKSGDFSGFILKEAEDNNRVSLLKANIQNFTSNGQAGNVHTSKGDYQSKKIFQSVLKPPEFNNLKVDISLIQHFLGMEINASRHLFDPEVPVFMDFDVPQENGISFMYLLPFSKTRALVEYTIFSNSLIEKKRYRKQIRSYLSTKYGLKKNSYSVEREEFGAIPMEDRKYPAKFCDFVWNIGTVGGLPKPSTGYTFNRIQKHSSAIIKALESEKELPENHLSPYRFRVYDLMMLYLLQQEKNNALKSRNEKNFKNKKDLQTFIQHYEKLTKWMIKTMPAKADMLIKIDGNQKIKKVVI